MKLRGRRLEHELDQVTDSLVALLPSEFEVGRIEFPEEVCRDNRRPADADELEENGMFLAVHVSSPPAEVSWSPIGRVQ